MIHIAFQTACFALKLVTIAITLAGKQTGSRGYKTFSCSTQLSMKFIMLINVKMQIVGILTFISVISISFLELKKSL